MGIWNDAINDPSTQQASMSRICFGSLIGFVILLTVFLMGVAAYLFSFHDPALLQKILQPFIDLLKAIGDLVKSALYSAAALYGGNSVARVVKGQPAPDAQPAAPDSPGAPAAPAPGPDPGAPAPAFPGGATPDPGGAGPDPGTIEAPDPASGHHVGPAKPAS